MDRRIQVASGIVGLCAVGAVAWVGLRRPEPGPDVPLHVPEDRFEVPELADPAVVEQAFGAVRAVLAGQEAQAEGLGAYAGRRVYACAYQIAARALCGTGTGRNLEAAVLAAANGLRDQVPDPSGALLKLDFVTDEVRTRWPARGFTHGVGVHGLHVTQNGAESWLTPSELLEVPVLVVVHHDKPGVLDEQRLHDALQERNPAIGDLPPDFSFVRTRTTSWVERHPVGSGIVRTYRTHAWELGEMEPDLLLQRAFWAGDHLASIVSPRGRIRYHYDPALDQESRGYNLLRHAGTTWSLLQAWERTGHEPWLLAARAGMHYLLERTVVQERQGPFGGGTARWVKESRRIKLGGAGLGLLMLAEYTAATGDEAYLEEARQFATYLVSAQLASGEFIAFNSVDPDGGPEPGTSAYYPGEAIVGLMRLYSVDPNPLWLDTAKRGASWLIRVRDAGKTPRTLANDHWLMMGLSRLYAETRDPVWVDHSLKLAEAVAIQQARHVDHVAYHRDYAGGYYEPPRSTPAATRAEGLVAVLDTCRLAGLSCPEVRATLEATVLHQLQTQYTPETLWWLPAPEEAVGAFYGGLIDVTIRNDYVQHNLSAILGLERLARLDAGERLPGDPTWTLADQEAFNGLSERQIAELQAFTRRIRGDMLWDRVARRGGPGAAAGPEASPIMTEGARLSPFETPR